MSCEDFRGMLAGKVGSYFPNIRQNGGFYRGIPHLDKKVEAVAHWVLFGAGMDIDFRNHGKPSLIKKESFSPERIEPLVEKYKSHLSNLLPESGE